MLRAIRMSSGLLSFPLGPGCHSEIRQVSASTVNAEGCWDWTCWTVPSNLAGVKAATTGWGHDNSNHYCCPAWPSLSFFINRMGTIAHPIGVTVDTIVKHIYRSSMNIPKPCQGWGAHWSGGKGTNACRHLTSLSSTKAYPCSPILFTWGI